VDKPACLKDIDPFALYLASFPLPDYPLDLEVPLRSHTVPRPVRGVAPHVPQFGRAPPLGLRTFSPALLLKFLAPAAPALSRPFPRIDPTGFLTP